MLGNSSAIRGQCPEVRKLDAVPQFQLSSGMLRNHWGSTAKNAERSIPATRRIGRTVEQSDGADIGLHNLFWITHHHSVSSIKPENTIGDLLYRIQIM